MMSVRYQINKNKRNYQFEIFGYDFMLDEEFNLFLIEINDDPGIEESSPWIQIIIPRMLDDALRLTIDQIFPPHYDFSKNYKKENDSKKIAENLGKKDDKNNLNIKTGNNLQTKNKNGENYFTENNNINENKDINISSNKKNNNYITPFPVPGYKNDDNLWEFVCDLNGDDPLDKFLDKKLTNENTCFTGIKYLFNKKKN